MEIMKKVELIKRLFTNEEIVAIDNRNRELEEENKALRENVNHRAGRCADLSEENERLRECNKSQSEVINNVFIPQKERLEEEIKKLKEENKKLKNDLETVGGAYFDR